MRIGLFAKENLADILAVQARCPEAARWVERDYELLVGDPGGLLLVAELETMDPPKLLGFAAFHRVIDEAELRNMAVDPEHQHQGVGRALLEDARRRMLEAGVKRIFLEVRASNRPALGLYYSMGFWIYFVRKDYYRDPKEDALVLCLPLSPPLVVGSLR